MRGHDEVEQFLVGRSAHLRNESEWWQFLLTQLSKGELQCTLLPCSNNDVAEAWFCCCGAPSDITKQCWTRKNWLWALPHWVKWSTWTVSVFLCCENSNASNIPLIDVNCIQMNFICELTVQTTSSQHPQQQVFASHCFDKNAKPSSSCKFPTLQQWIQDAQQDVPSFWASFHSKHVISSLSMTFECTCWCHHLSCTLSMNMGWKSIPGCRLASFLMPKLAGPKSKPANLQSKASTSQNNQNSLVATVVTTKSLHFNQLAAFAPFSKHFCNSKQWKSTDAL